METRKHNRLKEYDYSQNGYYFITICTTERSKILCDISVGANCVRPKTTFSEIGKLVDKNISILNDTYETVRVDKYVIIPNHIHLIVVIQNGRTQCSPLRYHVLLNNLRVKSQNRLAFAFGKNPFMTILFATKRIIYEFGSISITILLNGQRINTLFNKPLFIYPN